MLRNLLSIAVLSLSLLSASTLCAPAAGQAADIRGEIIQLEYAGGSFAAIYRVHQRGEGRGGIVLMHDQGGNADSFEVIRPLRLGLAESGWDTLSLELPAAQRSEETGGWLSRQGEIQTRLLAGLDWLKGRGQATRVVVALGDTGAIVLVIAATLPPGELQALVLVSTAVEADAALAALETLDLPILDIQAERDHIAVAATAATRRGAAKKGGNERYRQRVLAGSAAGFHRQEAGLIAEIRAWLATTVD